MKMNSKIFLLYLSLILFISLALLLSFSSSRNSLKEEYQETSEQEMSEAEDSDILPLVSPLPESE